MNVLVFLVSVSAIFLGVAGLGWSMAPGRVTTDAANLRQLADTTMDESVADLSRRIVEKDELIAIMHRTNDSLDRSVGTQMEIAQIEERIKAKTDSYVAWLEERVRQLEAKR